MLNNADKITTQSKQSITIYVYNKFPFFHVKSHKLHHNHMSISVYMYDTSKAKPGYNSERL